ncbi:cysteine-rich CWC family protein [Brevibacillus daliensis]|uniref:cysteine-rich CWC family protein n=1 Tax=Brevibacillus daliensis TaxID=2892995 RepID=UPI001E4E3F07|nr:cysteine-rich CWC family protein [Brevibacillus daliensis]
MHKADDNIEERRCPLCGGVNACSVTSGDCWCFHMKVPQELRDQIPSEHRGKTCICRKCVEEYLAKQRTL